MPTVPPVYPLPDYAHAWPITHPLHLLHRAPEHARQPIPHPLFPVWFRCRVALCRYYRPVTTSSCWTFISHGLDLLVPWLVWFAQFSCTHVGYITAARITVYGSRVWLVPKYTTPRLAGSRRVTPRHYPLRCPVGHLVVAPTPRPPPRHAAVASCCDPGRATTRLQRRPFCRNRPPPFTTFERFPGSPRHTPFTRTRFTRYGCAGGVPAPHWVWTHYPWTTQVQDVAPFTHPWLDGTPPHLYPRLDAFDLPVTLPDSQDIFTLTLPPPYPHHTHWFPHTLRLVYSYPFVLDIAGYITQQVCLHPIWFSLRCCRTRTFLHFDVYTHSPHPPTHAILHYQLFLHLPPTLALYRSPLPPPLRLPYTTPSHPITTHHTFHFATFSHCTYLLLRWFEHYRFPVYTFTRLTRLLFFFLPLLPHPGLRPHTPGFTTHYVGWTTFPTQPPPPVAPLADYGQPTTGPSSPPTFTHPGYAQPFVTLPHTRAPIRRFLVATPCVTPLRGTTGPTPHILVHVAHLLPRLPTWWVCPLPHAFPNIAQVPIALPLRFAPHPPYPILFPAVGRYPVTVTHAIFTFPGFGYGSPDGSYIPVATTPHTPTPTPVSPPPPTTTHTITAHFQYTPFPGLV